jgi:hypothetical protein
MTQIDWLPRKREAQIALSKDWQTILVAAKVTAWSIPTTEVTALKNLRGRRAGRRFISVCGLKTPRASRGRGGRFFRR